jgi:iron(III) transport system substrate-binding protein
MIKRSAAAICARTAIVCLALATMVPAPAARADDSADTLRYRGADREQKLIEGAKREGQVVIYSAMIVNQALRPLADSFGKKYPFLKLTYWRADSEDIMQKISAEVRATNVVADIVEGTGVSELAAHAGLVQPFVTPALAAYPEAYRDPQGLWVPTRLSYYSVAYNTRLAPPPVAPKTYADLLDPRWKGKMAWRIGSASGADLFLTNLRLAWGEEKAKDYFAKLKDQKIVNFGAGSARTLVDRIIAGEYAIALNIFAHHPLISKAKGAPVDSRLMDPVASTAATMAVVKGAHHPNAAMLLMDFILSKEGQQILVGAEYYPADPSVPPLLLNALARVGSSRIASLKSARARSSSPLLPCTRPRLTKADASVGSSRITSS